MEKTVYSFIGDNCFYFIKSKLDGRNIIRPLFPEEIISREIGIDEIFYVDDISHLDEIYQNSLEYMKTGVYTSKLSSNCPQVLIPPHVMSENICGAKMYLTLSNTRHTWKMRKET